MSDQGTSHSSSRSGSDDGDPFKNCFKGNKWMAMNTNADVSAENARRQSFAFLLEWVQTEAADILEHVEFPKDLTFMNMQEILSRMFDEFRSKQKRVRQLESRLRDRDAHIQMLEAVINELQLQFVSQIESKEKEKGIEKDTPTRVVESPNTKYGLEDPPAASSSSAKRRTSGGPTKNFNGNGNGNIDANDPMGFVGEKVDEIYNVTKSENTTKTKGKTNISEDTLKAMVPVTDGRKAPKRRDKDLDKNRDDDNDEDILRQESKETISSLSSDDSFDPLVA